MSITVNPPRSFNKKVVIVTGELSGEIHALHLIKALQESAALEFSGVGSDRLKDAGVILAFDYRNISVTGLSEVFCKLNHIRRAFKLLKEHILSVNPALIILVDFPGFNLRIARFAARHRIPVVYFIPPQIWAWRMKRIETIKAFVQKVICILPFEKVLYERHGIDVTYVGHPFVGLVKPLCEGKTFLDRAGIIGDEPIITMMPGSRHNEIARHMPFMARIIGYLETSLKDFRIIIPVADNIDPGFIRGFIGHQERVTLIHGYSHDALACSAVAIIASGTATLEAAILGIPSIVIYRISWVSYLAARLLVRIKYISLPNIVAGKEVFPEFVQHIDPKLVAEKAAHMVNNYNERIFRDMAEIRENLSGHDSYGLAGKAVIEFLERLYGPIPKTP